MKKLTTIALAFLFVSFLVVSCSNEKKDEKAEEETKEEVKVEQDEPEVEKKSCLEIVQQFKQAVLNSVEIIDKVVNTEEMTLADNLEVLQNALVLQKDIQELGQQNITEQCWEDFLVLQLKFAEALLKVQDKLEDGDMLGAFLESMGDVKEGMETANEIKELITN